MGRAPFTAEEWQRYLLPLPQQLRFGPIAEMPPTAVGLVLARAAGPVERQAAAELEALFARQAGCRPQGSGFSIILGVVDALGQVDGVPIPGAERLAEVPNRDQAYLIAPRGEGGLVLGGGGPRGVYYAALTLAQLLAPVLDPQHLSVPLVEVLDWPELEERGLWNFPEPATWIPWLASLKLNYGKMADTRLQPLTPGGPRRALLDAELLTAARHRAFNYLPYILHLNFLHDLGLFSAYPELAGVGEGALAGRYAAHKEGNQHRVPCASQPVLVEILADWLADLAGQGAGEVSCWLSERPAQCGCSRCTGVGQFVLEARAFVAAWRLVRAAHPGFGIRLFLSTTTVEGDHQILAETPPEVKIERCCATALERVACAPRDLFANPLLDHWAAQGRWLASYDVPLTVNAAVDTPEFKLPESSAHRVADYLRQLHRRGYRGAYGMMAWTDKAREICGYNIHALAEWAWNPGGRTEEEFALAWATRQGHEEPAHFATWATLVGELEFDLYDADFPIAYSWGRAVEMVRAHQRPVLGTGLFRYFAEVGDFARKAEACARAARLAAGWVDPLPARETAVLASYLELAAALYGVAESIALGRYAELPHQRALRLQLERLRQAGAANGAAIRAWRGALGPEPWHVRVHDAIAATQRTVGEICRYAEERYLYLLEGGA